MGAGCTPKGSPNSDTVEKEPSRLQIHPNAPGWQNNQYSRYEGFRVMSVISDLKRPELREEATKLFTHIGFLYRLMCSITGGNYFCALVKSADSPSWTICIHTGSLSPALTQ